ncbi:MAG: hypothetical protein V1676_03615 [Candidatus Diapherotrites archaeon]
MAKKTKDEIIKEVLQALDKKKNTINEIATDIGSNWATVRNTLAFLEKYGLVAHNIEKNANVYFRVTKNTEDRNYNTYFNLPITEKQKQMAYSLFGTVQEEYRKAKGTNPGRIIAQKTIEDVQEKYNLDIPSGWYLFGRTTLVQYDPLVQYPVSDGLITGEMRECIIATAKEYMERRSVEAMMFHQYKKYNNKLYLTRLNLSKISSDKVDLQDRETKQAIQEYLSNFLLYLPKGKNSEEVQEVVSKYVLTMNKLLLGNENLNSIKAYLNDAFSATWRYVATFNLYNDLQKFYSPFELLNVMEKLNAAGQDAIEQIEFISEYYAPPKEPPALKLNAPEEKSIRDIFIEMSREPL